MTLSLHDMCPCWPTHSLDSAETEVGGGGSGGFFLDSFSIWETKVQVVARALASSWRVMDRGGKVFELETHVCSCEGKFFFCAQVIGNVFLLLQICCIPLLPPPSPAVTTVKTLDVDFNRVLALTSWLCCVLQNG